MLNRIADILSKIPPARLAVCLWLIMLVRTGVWAMGSFPEQLVVALQPFQNTLPYQQGHYIFWNYLGPFVAQLLLSPLPLSTQGFAAAFFIYCLVFAGAGTALFCHLVVKRFEAPAARAALLLYFLMPVSATAYFWVGMDGLTFLLLLLPFVYPRSAPWGIAVGFFLGLQHFEQGLVAYGALAASLLLARKRKFELPMALENASCTLVGVVAGKLALVAWFHVQGITVNTGRISWLGEHVEKIMSYTLYHPHFIYASLFGCGWLAIMRFAEWKEARAAFFLPLAVLLLLPFLAEDETRVVALTSFPLLAGWVFFNPRFLGGLDKSFVGLLAVLYAVVPWLWVWRGEPRWSAFPYDIAYISNKLFGWPTLPQDLFKWLFYWS